MIIKVGQIWRDNKGTRLHIVSKLNQGRVSLKFTNLPDASDYDFETLHQVSLNQLKLHIKLSNMRLDVLKTANNIKDSNA